jgi:hypothetical protein
MGVVCWESCEANCPDPGLGCTDPTATNYSAAATTDDGSCKFLVTFKVDMNGVPFAFNDAFVNGSFNGWCGSCNILTDSDNDGIWESTFELNNGNYEFLFTANTWDFIEAMTDGSSCTNTTVDGSNTFINRTLTVDGVIEYETAWEACPVSCPSDITGDGVVNIDDFLALNSAFGNVCSGCPADITGDGVVNIDDFLALNSAFGTVCQ